MHVEGMHQSNFSARGTCKQDVHKEDAHKEGINHGWFAGEGSHVGVEHGDDVLALRSVAASEVTRANQPLLLPCALARAGWISMLLSEWLRNAVQPPGARTLAGCTGRRLTSEQAESNGVLERGARLLCSTERSAAIQCLDSVLRCHEPVP